MSNFIIKKKVNQLIYEKAADIIMKYDALIVAIGPGT